MRSKGDTRKTKIWRTTTYANRLQHKGRWSSSHEKVNEKKESKADRGKILNLAYYMSTPIDCNTEGVGGAKIKSKPDKRKYIISGALQFTHS